MKNAFMTVFHNTKSRYFVLPAAASSFFFANPANAALEDITSLATSLATESAAIAVIALGIVITLAIYRKIRV